ncbi:MAG: sulfurtransferase [Caldilineaceae bacterium]|nr:sulfurtransferase [Caldilineaceae bacterium]
MKTHIWIAFALLLLNAVVAACVAPAAATTPEIAPVEVYANPDVLVDTQWVLDHLDDPNVRLVDVSGKAEDYAAGHLPGAVYVSTGGEMTNPEDSTKGQILTQDALSALLNRIGVTPETTVVFYDGSSNLLATRAFWVLKYYQHSDVKVYNGGRLKWAADGRQLVTDAVTVTPTEYVAQDPDLAIRTTTEYVLEHLDDPNTVLCDTRGPEEFTGTDVRAKRGGHIPGAINVEWVNAVNDDGAFKEARALFDLYTKAGFVPDKQIITYCQTGVRGAHTWFVLKELLGYPDVRNYDGSWEEYGNRDDTPIES